MSEPQGVEVSADPAAVEEWRHPSVEHCPCHGLVGHRVVPAVSWHQTPGDLLDKLDSEIALAKFDAAEGDSFDIGYIVGLERANRIMKGEA